MLKLKKLFLTLAGLLLAGQFCFAEPQGLPDETSVPPSPRPPISLINPNGGETLKSGEMFKISWTPVTGAKHYQLDISYDNGKEWVTIADLLDPMNSHYDWRVGPRASKECLVKVFAVTAAEIWVSDQSDRTFRVELAKTKSKSKERAED